MDQKYITGRKNTYREKKISLVDGTESTKPKSFIMTTIAYSARTKAITGQNCIHSKLENIAYKHTNLSKGGSYIVIHISTDWTNNTISLIHIFIKTH